MDRFFFISSFSETLTGSVHLLDFFIRFALKNSQKVLRLGPYPSSPPGFFSIFSFVESLWVFFPDLIIQVLAQV